MTAVQQWWLNSPTNTEPFDPYWENVRLLLRGGAALGTSTAEDRSPDGLPYVSLGDGTFVDTGGRWGTSCIRSIKASGDPSSVAFFPGTRYWVAGQPLTIELWIKPMLASNHTAAPRILVYGPTAYAGAPITDPLVTLAKYSNAALLDTSLRWGLLSTTFHSASPGSSDGWAFVTVTCDAGGTWRYYLNGIFQSAWVGGLPSGTFGDLTLGSNTSGGLEAFDIKYDDVRLTLGVNRYPVGNGNFSPPTARFPTR